MKVDFHTHTLYSPDSIASVDQVLRAAHDHGLGRVVITDHNCIRGALAAVIKEPEFVIVGEEIKTTHGELLASFVKEEVPAHLDPFRTMELLKAQGAFISVSHPMDYLRCGWPLELLEELAPYIDAIEVANARVYQRATNDAAAEFARSHGIPGTAGSDAHHPLEIGRMALELPEFHDAESLRKVIGQGMVVGIKSPAWVHLLSISAKMAKTMDQNLDLK